MRASRPTNLIFFHLIILIIFGEENELWSSSICLFLYCTVISSVRLPPTAYSEFLHRCALSLKNHKSPASLPQVKLIFPHLTPPPSLCDVSVWTGPGTGTARRHQSWLVLFLKRLVLLTQRRRDWWCFEQFRLALTAPQGSSFRFRYHPAQLVLEHSTSTFFLTEDFYDFSQSFQEMSREYFKIGTTSSQIQTLHVLPMSLDTT
jgi:hypothetical protein